jgi:hypothetical protein
MSPGSPGRCVVFFYEGYLGISPSTVNLSRAFATAGYDVTIYSTPTSAPAVGDVGNVKILVLETSRIGRLISRLGIGRLRVGSIAKRIFPLTPVVLFAFRALWAEVRAAVRGNRRSVYVGVDMNAVLGALLCSAVFRRTYIFLSLELTLSPSQRRGIGAAMVRLAYRRSAATLTQGLDRLAPMTRDLGWAHPKVFILPNAPFAEATNRDPDELFLRAALNIPQDRRIALQAGMILDKTCCASLARGFVGLNDWALVLHERTRHSLDEPYMVALRRVNSENLYLSLDPVPYDQVDRVFESADVGLVFYEPSGPYDDDFRFISSSGKLTHCLKYGKPVLVSALPPLVELIHEFDCGVVINDPSNSAEIGTALQQISERYDQFSENASRCFAERYDFGRAVEPVIQFANSL